MRIAILGSGNGGCAVAFDWAAHGHAVRLFDFERFPDAIRAVREQGGIRAEGALSGFQPVTSVGHDVAKALDGAELIFAVGPAYSTRPFAESCRPHLRAGQIVIVCPGSCGGAIEFKTHAGLGLRDERVVVAETSTLPYAVRVVAPGAIRVFLKLRGGLFLAAAPAGGTAAAHAAVRDVYPALQPAAHVLQTSLQNGNPVIHPAVTLLNAARIESTRGAFAFYEEGVTPAAGRLMQAVDRERIQLGEALGVRILPDPELGCLQGYMTEPTYDAGFSRAPGFRGIRAPSTLDDRYFHEDVGYGLVFLQSLGRRLGRPTPALDALIVMASILMRREYAGEARRTLDSLGLTGRTAAELIRQVS